MSKKIILIIIVVGVISLVVYNILKKEEAEFTLVEVVRGNVIQEVSETGQVQTGGEVNLGFKNSGTIARIYVEVGNEVWLGSNLAKLDTTGLIIERSEAQATLEIAQAKLNQLLTGATPEEIQVAQTTVDNAQIALEDAQKDFAEDLSQAYEDALNTLDSSYLKGSGALTTVVSIRKTYFYGNDQESITVKTKEKNINSLLAEAKEYIDLAQTSLTNENIDSALTILKNSLSDIYNDLGIIRDMTEAVNYANVVSATDKSSLDTERLNVNTGLTNVINAQQTITSTKLTGEASVNTAQGKLKKAQDELILKTAEPSSADIDLYQAQVRQAQAKLDLLENKVWEATLRSPTQGKVTKINKKVGEMIQPALGEGVITILPASPYKIEVDIYEEDIVKMKVGNPVDINLVAFPDKTFQGKVISIDPAEKIVEGVVYYKVTVNFEEVPQGIKPGMTADLTIKTALRENVLVIPEETFQKKDGQTMVQVFQDNKVEDREIEVGLVGSDDMVEVISGLAEGESVIIK